TGAFAFVWVIIRECNNLGFSFEGVQLVGYTLGVAVVAIALEMVWRRPAISRPNADAALAETHHFGRGAANAALSIGTVLLWVCWVASPGVMTVLPAFWLVLVIIALPPAILVSRSAIEHLLRHPGSPETTSPPSVVEVSLE